MNSTTGPSSQVAEGITYANIDDIISYGIRICINYASQIGASFILLIVLLLLTAPEKRQTLVFGFNTLSLAINVVRNVLQCLYFTGPFWKAYTILENDYSNIPRSAYDISITGVVLTFLMVITLECSLVLQVRAVTSTMSPRQKLAVIIISAGIALATLGLHFAVSILNIQAINGTESFANYAQLEADVNYVLAASICWFSFVFSAKLGYALVQRRKLGLTQFGPMQVIFIMGCQTLFIPAIFFILASVIGDEFPEISSQGLTVAAIFLPLSSIWASASTKGAGGSTVSSMQRGFWGIGRGSGSATSSGHYSDKSPGATRVANTSMISASQGRTSASMEKNTDADDMIVHVNRSLDINGDKA